MQLPAIFKAIWTALTDGQQSQLRINSQGGLITDIGEGSSFNEYETVAASQTAQVLGATGATGDVIAGVLVIPATTTPGLVTLLDNATSIPLFVGGTTTVNPFYIQLGMKSVSGAWKITTGTSVSVIAIGNFT